MSTYSIFWRWDVGGRLSTFSAFMMGAYSRWALIRGWALIRINTTLAMQPVKTDTNQMNTNQNTKTWQTRLNLLLLNNGADKSWS